MATNFPAALDVLVNPTATDYEDDISHADQHANANDAIEALQAKVGVDGSSVVTSLDYRVATLESASAAKDFKNSVRAVATSNITLSGAQTIDGVSIVAGDRVLVAGQSTGANNGIYVCAAGAWSRASDADSSSEMTAGMMVPVTEGTAYADTLWVLTTNDPITLGSTSLAFDKIPSTLTALAGNGLGVSGQGLVVNVDGSTIEINSDTLRVKDAGVTEAKVGLSDVTTNDVTSSKHGFAPKSPADATKFLNGAATPAFAQVKDSDLSTSDITTNDASVSKHGFLKKLSGNAYDCMGGDGNWKPNAQMYGSTRAAATNGSLGAGTTRYCNPNSGVLLESTQSDAEIKIPRDGRIRFLRANVAAVPASGTATIKVMKNGSTSGAPAISLTSGSSTGWNADDSTILNVSAGDLITLELVGASSGTVSIRGLTITFEWS
jgi:hypothetical protein